MSEDLRFVAQSGDLAVDADGQIYVLVEDKPFCRFADHIEEIDPACHPWFREELGQLRIEWDALDETEAYYRAYLAWAPDEPDPDADRVFAHAEYREGAL